MPGTVLAMIIGSLLIFWGSVVAMLYIFITARNRERLALIEKGKDASIFKTPRNRKHENLKWGLVIVFLGIGVFVGGILMDTNIIRYEGILMFAFPLIFGGSGLLFYYFLVKDKNKHLLD